MSHADPHKPGLLGDTPERDYSAKLQRFNAFAAPELRALVRSLGLRPGMRVLDVGCGSGEALHWLQEEVGPTGRVVGVDLATAHVQAARAQAAPGMEILQGDVMTLDLPLQGFDQVWCVNTIHHLRDPLAGVQRLLALLQPGGGLALGQSSFLPDMVFAWNARLERLTTEAVRAYYRERYGLDERALAAVRATAGLLKRAGASEVGVRSVLIERLAPLRAEDRAYLYETQFRDTWGERLRPYLAPEDFAELTRLCDPQDPGFALDREDFHFLQSFSLAVGRRRG